MVWWTFCWSLRSAIFNAICIGEFDLWWNRFCVCVSVSATQRLVSNICSSTLTLLDVNKTRTESRWIMTLLSWLFLWLVLYLINCTTIIELKWINTKLSWLVHQWIFRAALQQNYYLSNIWWSSHYWFLCKGDLTWLYHFYWGSKGLLLTSFTLEKQY